jgi:hypothetical protein
MEPRIDVRGKTKPTETKFNVDACAGPEQDNAWLYSRVGLPLIDLCLVGGGNALQQRSLNCRASETKIAF